MQCRQQEERALKEVMQRRVQDERGQEETEPRRQLGKRAQEEIVQCSQVFFHFPFFIYSEC